MSDFCDCSQCPHHCGMGDEEEIIEEEVVVESAPAGTTTPEEKVDELKKEIEDLGFKLEETEDGTRVTME